MKQQQLVSWRSKSPAEVKAEIKRLATEVVKSENQHATRAARRDRAQLLTIVREKQLLEVTTNHE